MDGDKKNRLAKRVCGGCCCILFLTIISLLIAYGVRLGSGDESHTLATSGTCREGTSAPSMLKVMTYNLFLIYCVPTAKCQDEDTRKARTEEITAWFQDREEDVVMFQEVWSFHDLLRDGMTNAGYCHYVMTDRANGSGLAIFSKYPIEEQDFKDWFDAFGIGDGMAPNPLNFEAYVADKGVLYAKIQKDGQTIHLFNMHTSSDTSGDNHDLRIKQFGRVRDFVDLKVSSNDLVLIGGDFNEDPNCRLNRCEGEPKCEDEIYYKNMLDVLSVGVPETIGNNTYTYDTETNSLLKGLYEGSDCDFYRYRLDYIFYSENHLMASNTSYCEIISPLASDGTHLSDHFPVTCVYEFDTSEAGETNIHNKESEQQDAQAEVVDEEETASSTQANATRL